MSSSSSASTAHEALEPGTTIQGFRVERVLGRGRRSVVYEATQVSLERTVALEVFSRELSDDPDVAARFLERSRLQAALDHPSIVAVHEAGWSDEGAFVATQLIRGRTLAELSSLEAPRRRILAVLRQVAEALDAAHAAGLPHGDVKAEHVLVDSEGRAHLGGFDPTATGASEVADRAAFAALLSACVPAPPPVRGAATAVSMVDRIEQGHEAAARRRRQRLAIGVTAALLGAAAVAAAAFAIARDKGQADGSAPPVAEGAIALGSDLAPGAARTVDCIGNSASGGSPGCTVVQSSLPARPLTVSSAGAIRRWAVRGALGRLELQVIRPAFGEYVVWTRSQVENVPDRGVHSFATDLELRPGDVVGVQVTPGASVGIRQTDGASTRRWFGALGPWTPAAPTSAAGTGFDVEVLVRVDVVLGARRRFPEQATGSRAASLPPGDVLVSEDVEPAAGRLLGVAVVRLDSGVALDLIQSGRRVARIAVPDADPDGELLEFATNSGPAVVEGRHLEWSQPDGSVVVHDYAIERESFRLIS